MPHEYPPAANDPISDADDRAVPADLAELVPNPDQDVLGEPEAAPVYDILWGGATEVGIVIKSMRAKSGGRIQVFLSLLF